MMKQSRKIEGLAKVWDTGATMPWDRPVVDDVMAYYDDFKMRTGSQRVVRLRWNCGGAVVECAYPAALLPDRSGVVLCDALHIEGGGGCKCLHVLNADGSLRCRIEVPRVNEESLPECGFLELPKPFESLGVAWGVPSNDGHFDWVLEVDWQTGRILRAVAAPNMRY